MTILDYLNKGNKLTFDFESINQWSDYSDLNKLLLEHEIITTRLAKYILSTLKDECERDKIKIDAQIIYDTTIIQPAICIAYSEHTVLIIINVFNFPELKKIITKYEIKMSNDKDELYNRVIIIANSGELELNKITIMQQYLKTEQILELILDILPNRLRTLKTFSNAEANKEQS